jgi:hypothetical protein
LAKSVARRRITRHRAAIPLADGPRSIQGSGHVMKRPLSVGLTIQLRPDSCPSCDSRRIIKRGLRKNSLRHLQIYCCKDCGRYFASLQGLKGVKYPPRVIARALCLYCLGFTQDEVVRRLLFEHRIAVPRRTLSHWIAGYRSITTFCRLRSAAVLRFGQDMIRERILDRRQTYEYKVHIPKLALTADAVPWCVTRNIESYLLSVFEDFPDHLFRDDEVADDLYLRAAPDGQAPALPPAMRSSKSSFETLPFARIEKENLANHLAALGLLLARKNKDRHPSVQDFMLANNSCTIACEVPVYLTAEDIAFYKSQGFFLTLPESAKPVTGHIDVVQVRSAFIHLLDYKPNARDIDPVNQLIICALALASRTRLPVKMFKCAWFDEKDYFEFFPLQAGRARKARA